jgi:PAS domain S-box-containing protein
MAEENPLPPIQQTPGEAKDGAGNSGRSGFLEFLKRWQTPPVANAAGDESAMLRQMEEKLAASERRNQIISELFLSTSNSYRVEPDGVRTLEWITDNSFELLTGYSKEELFTQDLLSIIHPEDHEKVMRDTARLMQGETVSTECRIITKNGEEVWMALRRKPEWNDAHTRIMRTYGGMSDITALKRSEEVLKRQNANLEALRDTTPELVETLEMNRLLERIATRMAALMDAPNASVSLVDYENNLLITRMGIGRSKEAEGLKLPPGTGAIGEAWKQGRVHVQHHYGEWEQRAKGFDWIKSIAAVPMISKGKVIGVIDVAFEKHHDFSEEEIALLEQFGVLAEITLRNSALFSQAKHQITSHQRSEESLRRRNAYLEALQATIPELAEALELDTLLERIVARMALLMETPNAAVSIIDPENTLLITQLGIGRSKESEGLKLSPGMGAIGVAWKKGRMHVQHRYDQWEQRAKGFEWIKSIAAIPMIADGKIIGVIDVSFEEHHDFLEEEIALLEQFSGMAAIALRNSILFSRAQHEIAERQRSEEILKRKNAYLEALHATIPEVAENLDIDTLLERIVTRMASLVQTPNAVVSLVDHENNLLITRLGIGLSKQAEGLQLPPGIGADGEAWSQGRTYIQHHYPQWDGRVKGFEWIKSIAAVPMIVDGRVIGIIDVPFEEHHEFSEEEIVLMEQFSKMAAIALRNSTLSGYAQPANPSWQATNLTPG